MKLNKVSVISAEKFVSCTGGGSSSSGDCACFADMKNYAQDILDVFSED